MPIRGARYRWVTRGGKRIRLAFVNNKVVETKVKGYTAKRVTRKRRRARRKRR